VATDGNIVVETICLRQHARARVRIDAGSLSSREGGVKVKREEEEEEEGSDSGVLSSSSVPPFDASREAEAEQEEEEAVEPSSGVRARASQRSVTLKDSPFGDLLNNS